MPRTGRPPTARKAFNRREFEALLFVSATEDECCTWFGISERSLTRMIRREYGRNVTFATLSREKRLNTKLSLRRKVLAGAYGGDKTLLIFASKALGGLSDRVVVSEDESQFDRRLKEQRERDAAAAEAAAKAVTREDARVAAILALLNKATTPQHQRAS